MQETILIIVSTSLLTAIFMAVVGYILYVVKIRPGLAREVEKAGEVVEQRVKQGVLAAGEELLPKFRRKVSEGFTDALAEWPSSEMSRMARSGANLMNESLSNLFGKKNT